jgi:uncharacterized membrane protein
MKNLPVLMALLMIAVSVPMALKLVPPNGYFGFRTPKTLSSTPIWYAANQRAGFSLICAGVLTLAAWAALRMQWGVERANVVTVPVFMVLVMAALGASLLQLRKL